ncbi:unnamed protein product [Effrenium voratum]|uniref:Uncharacterized protein n=1 Tax=Effrenium voratum TaxID=2562239 RepID=A0AA36JQW5_9DINO|nr:unnamed protein product [Effrenium voratum]CAJ1435099.1 unnamed protein product [Effrenium voratum]
MGGSLNSTVLTVNSKFCRHVFEIQARRAQLTQHSEELEVEVDLHRAPKRDLTCIQKIYLLKKTGLAFTLNKTTQRGLNQLPADTHGNMCHSSTLAVSTVYWEQTSVVHSRSGKGKKQAAMALKATSQLLIILRAQISSLSPESFGS